MSGVLVEFIRQTEPFESREIRTPGQRERMGPDSVARWLRRDAIKLVIEEKVEENEPEPEPEPELQRRRRGRPPKQR